MHHRARRLKPRFGLATFLLLAPVAVVSGQSASSGSWEFGEGGEIMVRIDCGPSGRGSMIFTQDNSAFPVVCERNGAMMVVRSWAHRDLVLRESPISTYRFDASRDVGVATISDELGTFTTDFNRAGVSRSAARASTRNRSDAEARGVQRSRSASSAQGSSNPSSSSRSSTTPRSSAPVSSGDRSSRAAPRADTSVSGRSGQGSNGTCDYLYSDEYWADKAANSKEANAIKEAGTRDGEWISVEAARRYDKANAQGTERINAKLRERCPSSGAPSKAVGL